MKKTCILAVAAAMLYIAAALLSCSTDLTGEAELTVQARLLGTASADKGPIVETDVNLTPGDYKMAMTYFALIKDDATEVTLLDVADADAQIVDFSGGAPGTLIGLFAARSLPRGTYVGYKMRFLYLQMSYEAAFHVPSICSDAADPYIDEAVPTEKTFRQYFNAYGPFWKRDFIVEKPNGDEPPIDSWYWMRREVDASHTDFFIDSATTAHPSGGAAPESILDLFANDEFWGDAADYDDPTVKITIESGDTTGGLNATMEPFTLKAGTTIVLDVDVTDCMNFKEDVPAVAPAGVTFTDGLMDIGPGYSTEMYGDRGFHPFMPIFKVKEL